MSELQSAASRIEDNDAPLNKAHDGPIALVEWALTFISESL